MVFSHFPEKPGQNLIPVKTFGWTCCPAKLCQRFQPLGRSRQLPRWDRRECEREMSRRDTWLPGLRSAGHCPWSVAGLSFTTPLPPFLQRPSSQALGGPPRLCENKLRLGGMWGGTGRQGQRAVSGSPKGHPADASPPRPAPLTHIPLLKLALPRSLPCRRPPPPACPQCRPPARPSRPPRVPAPRPRPRSAGRRGRLCACSGRGARAARSGAERAGGGGTGTPLPCPRPAPAAPPALPGRLRRARSRPPRGPAVPAERPVCRRRGGGRCCGRPAEPRDWPPPGGWRVSRAPGVALGAARPALWRDEAFRGMRSSLHFD